jgi:hypothetical protein
MSQVSSPTFTYIERRLPEGPLSEGTPSCLIRDWPEEISDFLLTPARISRQLDFTVDGFDDEDEELDLGIGVSETPLPFVTVAVLFAWTVWLPLTLLGMVFLLLSDSHPKLYQMVHEDHWETKLTAALTPEAIEPFMREAFDSEYLFQHLIACGAAVAASNIPVLLKLLREQPNNDRFAQIIDKLYADHVGLYVYAAIKEQSIEQRDFILTQIEKRANHANVLQGTVYNILRAAAEDGPVIPGLVGVEQRLFERNTTKQVYDSIRDHGPSLKLIREKGDQMLANYFPKKAPGDDDGFFAVFNKARNPGPLTL